MYSSSNQRPLSLVLLFSFSRSRSDVGQARRCHCSLVLSFHEQPPTHADILHIPIEPRTRKHASSGPEAPPPWFPIVDARGPTDVEQFYHPFPLPVPIGHLDFHQGLCRVSPIRVRLHHASGSAGGLNYTVSRGFFVPINEWR